jgi:hypothetical protein
MREYFERTQSLDPSEYSFTSTAAAEQAAADQPAVA